MPASIPLVIALIGFVSGVAVADPSAAELRAEGEELGKKEQFVEAIERFKRAEVLESEPTNDCFIAISYARLEKWTQAKLFLERCRTKTGGVPKLKWYSRAERLIDHALSKRKFTAIAIKTQPESALVHLNETPADETFASPVFVWLPAGTHEAQVTKEGFHPQIVELRGSEGSSEVLVELEAEPKPKEPEALTPPESDPAAAPMLKASANDSNARSSGSSKTWGWVALGTGGVSLVGGVIAHISASGARSRALDPSNDYDAQLETFKQRRLITVGLYSLSGVLTGVGTYLLLDSDEERPGTQIGMQPSPRGRGALVTAGGEF